MCYIRHCADKGVDDQMSKLSIGTALSENDYSCPTLSKSQKKSLKKKEKKKSATMPAFEIEEVITPTPKSVSANEVVTTQAVEQLHQLSGSTENPVETEQVDKLKLARAFRKKLKQIAELESRIMSGDIKKPDVGQINKISKKKEYEKELALLEL